MVGSIPQYDINGNQLPSAVVPGLLLPITVADWDPASVRTYKAGGPLASDSNDGYTAPVATLARLSQVVPRFGNGRKVQTLIYEGTYTDNLDCRQWGYALSNGRLFRSTHDAAFGDSATDRKTCGYVTAVTGPDAGGAWTVGSSTTTTITLSGAEALTSEQAVGYRIRVTSGARAGDTVPIVAHDTATPSVIQIPTGFIGGAGTLAAAVTFMIEKPGVSVPGVLAANSTSGNVACLPVDAFNIAGFEVTSASAVALGCNAGIGTFAAAFMSAPNAGFSYVGGAMTACIATTTYSTPDGSTIISGGGTRHGGNITTLITGWIQSSTHSYHAYLGVGVSVILGQCAQGAYFGGSYVKATIATATFPNINPTPEALTIGAAGGQNVRLVGTGKITARGKLKLNGVDVSACTVIPIVLSGDAWELMADGVIGTGAGAAVIDASATGVINGKLISGRTTANTAAGSTPGNDIKVQGGTFQSFTSLTTDSWRDSGNNEFMGSFGPAITRGTTTTWFNAPVVAADPASPANGDVWYRSDLQKLSIRVGGSTVRSGAFS